MRILLTLPDNHQNAGKAMGADGGIYPYLPRYSPTNYLTLNTHYTRCGSPINFCRAHAARSRSGPVQLRVYDLYVGILIPRPPSTVHRYICNIRLQLQLIVIQSLPSASIATSLRSLRFRAGEVLRYPLNWIGEEERTRGEERRGGEERRRGEEERKEEERRAEEKTRSEIYIGVERNYLTYTPAPYIYTISTTHFLHIIQYSHTILNTQTPTGVDTVVE